MSFSNLLTRIMNRVNREKGYRTKIIANNKVKQILIGFKVEGL